MRPGGPDGSLDRSRADARRVRRLSRSTSYYDREAERYDETRGGLARAEAAADAVGSLVGRPGTAVDVGGGTGSVAAALAARGWSAFVADLSPGMLSLAVRRVPGRVVCADARRLPFREHCADLVSIVWLLHLLDRDTADRVVAQGARLVKPGGWLVSTVDKELAHGRAPVSDADERARVAAVAAGCGLVETGSARFTGASVWGSAREGDPEFTLVAFRNTQPPGTSSTSGTGWAGACQE